MRSSEGDRVLFKMETNFLTLPISYHLIITLPEDIASLDNEIKRAAYEIQNVDNAHKYVDDIIARIGDEDTTIGLPMIVDLASKAEAWIEYIQVLSESGY
jgi:hypothetical protein